MFVSYKWLKQYVDLPDSLTPEEVALKLTMSTVEVEGVKKQGENLENIIVGEVKKLAKHPGADKLQIVVVSGGREEYQVVCGGSNLREGMKVAFAKIGAKVRWHGEGELVTLEKAKIRGVESFGMICASTEIGLGEMFPLKNEKEILDLSNLTLPSPYKGEGIVGKPLAKVLGLDDVVFDIDNKSMTHRPDLWGHYGLAREVAALYGKKLKEYNVGTGFKPVRTNESGLNLSVRVEDEKLCPRYMAVAISGVEIKPSPEWLQRYLLAVGLRPINNIVDITNYLLLDLGQPMHAFDKRQLVGDKIIVRRAKIGEKFTTLDEQEHELTEEMLMVNDEKKAVALAGVMGGLDSEIKNDTTTIVYESANFNAANIRRTATKLGLRTESSARFEKSLDPHNAELALKRAVELTLEFCPCAKVASKAVDSGKFNLNHGPIELSLDFLNKKIGIEVDKKQVIKILIGLGFLVQDRKSKLSVTVPTWRATKDISIPEDLVEEVARIYGYGNIFSSLPSFPIAPPLKNELRLLERKIKNILALEHGFVEVYNYSFISPNLIEKFDLDKENFIELQNPIAKDRPFLRRNLWLGLMENSEKNLHIVDSVKLFEVGKVFNPEESGLRVSEKSDELLPRQDLCLGMVYVGKGVGAPFYELSGALVSMLEHFGCNIELKQNKNYLSPFVHGGRQAQVWVNGAGVGAIAEMNPVYSEKCGIQDRVAFVEINLDKLLSVLQDVSNYKKLSEYPEVLRDIAFAVDKKVEHAKIVAALKKVNLLIVSVELFDVYQGKNLGEGKKSMAYHITYQSFERTLTSEEVDKVHARVVKMIEKEFGGVIR